MPFVSDVNIYADLLRNTIGYWSTAEVCKAAEKVYFGNPKYIKENFSSPDEILNLPNQREGLFDLMQLISLQN